MRLRGIGGNDNFGDLRLQTGSPAIDAGNNDVDIDPATAGVQSLPEWDLDGRQRMVDEPAIVDTGSGAPPVVDMGAHEHDPALP